MGKSRPHIKEGRFQIMIKLTLTQIYINLKNVEVALFHVCSRLMHRFNLLQFRLPIPNTSPADIPFNTFASPCVRIWCDGSKNITGQEGLVTGYTWCKSYPTDRVILAPI